MNVQLNDMTAHQRSAKLQHAKPTANRPPARRRTPRPSTTKQPDRRPDDAHLHLHLYLHLYLHPHRSRRRPPARLPGDRHLPAAVPTHGDRHQPSYHHSRRHAPTSAAPTLDTGALGAGHLPRDVHAQRAPGRGHCQPPTRSGRRHRRCTRLLTLPGAIALSGVAGVNPLTFLGAMGGRALGSGRYRLLATPTTDGRAGITRQTSFQITR
jgi:hypothetical protein